MRARRTAVVTGVIAPTRGGSSRDPRVLGILTGTMPENDELHAAINDLRREVHALHGAGKPPDETGG
jgi:hypothetical protein